MMRLDRPIGTLLLLWPTLWALWLAGDGHPDGQLVLVFMLGVFLMRSAGCVINDYADRNIDGFVERTRSRPLAAGEVRPIEALLLFAFLSFVSFLLVLMTNQLTVELACVAVALAALYPFMKRYTYWPQVFLGAAFGWAIPMAFAAQTGHVPAASWLLFLANICWVVVYDTMYAMVDRDDDLKIGVKSTAVLFGALDRHMIGLFQLFFVLLMAAVGVSFSAGLFFYAALLLAALLSLYHQSLIFGRERDHCFKAFLHNNYLGAVIFGGIVIDHMHPFFLQG
ncbi:4-hydroxybenzoate octaprenyltransferase [Mariprofundus erugo]|uniref:4-hydroxybenzoate octaprenyltransferase n=2 Tax=Mariprofundus erugo TaxID=2528639 RepID=A0A5R9GHU2_9PROT|nr:4-hydroxybenzoate octaprenyltransferase [Mariprofundus erugo]TLS78461.1 4-hydroxybenzoate octaprenyltransferase [Mariprofundus erugo]